MKYLVTLEHRQEPSNDLEAAMNRAAYINEENVLDDERAALQLVNNIHRLKRVCNHINRGAKYHFSWNKESGKLLLYRGEQFSDWWLEMYIQPINLTYSELDIDQTIETSLHRINIHIFDRYMREKGLEKSVGYEGL